MKNFNELRVWFVKVGSIPSSLYCNVLNIREKIILNLKNWYIWVFVIVQKSKKALEALKLHSKMKKYNLTKSHICISNLNSIKNVAETFVVFFRNVSRIIFLFFEIVSKTIFDENLSSSLFDFWTLRFWETAIPLLLEKCQVQFAFAVTGNVFAVFFQLPFARVEK